jgi:phospholipid/cholesterol/gamma-HCH transport system substrate-binding protein
VRRFGDHNPVVVAVVAVVVLAAAITAALNLNRLPLLNSTATYRADFANSGGLVANDVVSIDGVRVGFVRHLALHGDVVRVTFTVDQGIRLGVDTTAAAKVETPLGTEFMALEPAGPGSLSGPIPVTHSSVPYTLVYDLNRLTTQIQQYNIPQLVKSLQTSSVTLAGTPTRTVAAALTGLARFSGVLARNHSQLATILSQGSQLTAVLSQRSSELVNLVGQGDLVLQVLEQRQAAIKELLDGTASLSAQITQLLGTSHAQLDVLLANLQSVSTALAKDSNSIASALPLLAAFSRYAANVTGSGPFADVSIPTLLIPDNVVKQCQAPGAYPSSNPLVGCRP